MNFLKRIFGTGSKHSGIIFIVEDTSTYALSIQSTIAGIHPSIKETTIFAKGEECLPQLSMNPDIIIIDYYLNSTDPTASNGLEIIKKIRAVNPSVFLILLSAQSDKDVLLTAIKNYQCTYVIKDKQAFSRLKEEISHYYSTKH